MIRFTLSLSLLLTLSGPATAQHLDCRVALTGDWSGSGHAEGFEHLQLDNRLQLRADGSYRMDSRFRNAAADDWQQQSSQGRWSAKPIRAGKKQKACRVTLSVSGDGYEATSESDYVILGKDQISVSGLRMQRRRGGGEQP